MVCVYPVPYLHFQGILLFHTLTVPASKLIRIPSGGIRVGLLNSNLVGLLGKL